MIPAVEAVSVLVALQESFVRLYNAGDLDGLMETCYTEDAYLLPSNHPRVSGRPQIRQFFHDLRAAGMGELSAETIQLDVSGDLAYCRCTMVLLRHPCAGA